MDFHRSRKPEDSRVVQWQRVTERTSMSTQLSGLLTIHHFTGSLIHHSSQLLLKNVLLADGSWGMLVVQVAEDPKQPGLPLVQDFGKGSETFTLKVQVFVLLD